MGWDGFSTSRSIIKLLPKSGSSFEGFEKRSVPKPLKKIRHGVPRQHLKGARSAGKRRKALVLTDGMNGMDGRSVFWKSKKTTFLKISQKLLDIFSWLFLVPLEDLWAHIFECSKKVKLEIFPLKKCLNFFWAKKEACENGDFCQFSEPDFIAEKSKNFDFPIRNRVCQKSFFSHPKLKNLNFKTGSHSALGALNQKLYTFLCKLSLNSSPPPDHHRPPNHPYTPPSPLTHTPQSIREWYDKITW